MKTTLTIKGMHCKSCEFLIKDSLEEIGVKNIKIDYKTGKLEFEFNEKEINLEKIKEVIKSAGDYEVI